MFGRISILCLWVAHALSAQPPGGVGILPASQRCVRCIGQATNFWAIVQAELLLQPAGPAPTGAIHFVLALAGVTLLTHPCMGPMCGIILMCRRPPAEWRLMIFIKRSFASSVGAMPTPFPTLPPPIAELSVCVVSKLCLLR